ncbi:hypothetical protein DL89DRAFT_186933 [Linderina pennispora]|uniref:Uncharacterized protein n=1 Tax=Linderina pennispora TaxID=61395 RepID=A0A1Y1VT07_9FUNG|nr:uncharacterized protein DL89DRAFT_186933 [Linderina pennispora]ORX64430.1 hypothetical protein DL89DRAFT_186933 [Linderina pennispora]
MPCTCVFLSYIPIFNAHLWPAFLLCSGSTCAEIDPKIDTVYAWMRAYLNTGEQGAKPPEWGRPGVAKLEKPGEPITAAIAAATAKGTANPGCKSTAPFGSVVELGSFSELSSVLVGEGVLVGLCVDVGVGVSVGV